MEPVLILAGPTASGKSALAIDVAEAVGAEIVSADSRQVYRRLDIGTAKASEADRRRVPHHLIDILEPGEAYSAGQFQRDARAAITEIQTRGRPVVVAGGSTLYVHGLVEGLADLPDVPSDLAALLEATAATAEGREALFAELNAGDPEAAATLDPTKSHRLMRLVGVLRTAGRRPSELWRTQAMDSVPHRLVVVYRPRAALYAAIDRRVERMIDEGLEAETLRLQASVPGASGLLGSTIGYREIVEAHARRLGVAWAIERIQRNSRRYAKRQLTWYRRYPGALWLDAETTTARSVLDAIAPWPETGATGSRSSPG